MHEMTFNWSDYIVFSSLLGCSLLIGVYFGFFSKQDSKKEYLFGGKRMGYIPVAISLLASCMSGITFMGAPTEVYLYGMSYTTTLVSTIFVCIATTRVFLPIFFKLQLSCVNEYLELRFSKEARKLASIIYIFGCITYISVVIYVPALAFSQVTKYSIHTITPIIASVCIIYTSMGGVKAVIWTDTFQFIFTVIGTGTILAVGLIDAGGISNVVKIAQQGRRTEAYDFSLDVYKRNTFWAVQSAQLIGTIGYFACSQKFVQKFLSVRAMGEAKKSIYGMSLGWSIIVVVCTLVGLTMYAKYHGCDPYAAGNVSKRDQTIVYFVIDVAGHIPGIPGIFLASLVSSSLSTMSASMNCLAGVIYDDFIAHRLSKSKDQEKRAARIMKFTVVIIGIISIGLVLAMERLGTIYEVVTTIGSLLNAPNLTLFVLGMLIPCVGKKGAIVGGYSALLFLMVLVGEKIYRSTKGKILYTTLETSIAECKIIVNQTITTTTVPPIVEIQEPFFLFRISMFYYTLMGTVVGITAALITSWLTNEMDSANVNPDYLSPVIHRFLPKKKYTEVPLKDIHSQTKEKENITQPF